MLLSTADLYDQFHQTIQVAQPIFKNFGGHNEFYGPIATLKVDHDFLLIKQALQTHGNNSVLVIDGDGALDCALLGDKLAAMAVENQWNGILINGCIRDAAVIKDLAIGVKAINTCPIKPNINGGGAEATTISFAGVDFIPGHFLYSDMDGILISSQPLI